MKRYLLRRLLILELFAESKPIEIDFKKPKVSVVLSMLNDQAELIEKLSRLDRDDNVAWKDITGTVETILEIQAERSAAKKKQA